MKIIVTKNDAFKTKWDNFIAANSHGNHLQLTNWLQSYSSYGFDYELALIVDEEQIIGGFGAVIAKFGFFKFYCIPGGPILQNSSNAVCKNIVTEIISQAKKHRCCYVQFNAPIFEDKSVFQNFVPFLKESKFEKGNDFKYIYSSNGLNWLDFKNHNSTDELLLGLKSSVRRDIRNAERKGTEIVFVKTESEIKKAYQLCLTNAKNNNYSIRDWESFKPTILELIDKKLAECITSFKDGEIKGAIFIVKSGNYYTYILGGTTKEKPDLLTGHLLQWEAIKFGFNQKCVGYNLSLGGSLGVQDFKKSFVSEQIFYKNSKYHLILRPIIFKFFLFFEKKIKPYKNNIASILAKLKRNKSS